jgi:hypothetical protein
MPALPAPPSADDYNKNWGASICVKARPDGIGSLGLNFSTITVNFTSGSSIPIYVWMHISGTQGTFPWQGYYCAIPTSGVATTYETFNNACWDGSGVIPPWQGQGKVDDICVGALSSQASEALDGLCLASIVFGE